MFAAGRPVELHAVGQYLVVGLDALALGPFTSQPHRLQPQQPANYQQGDEEIFFMPFVNLISVGVSKFDPSL